MAIARPSCDMSKSGVLPAENVRGKNAANASPRKRSFERSKVRQASPVAPRARNTMGLAPVTPEMPKLLVQSDISTTRRIDQPSASRVRNSSPYGISRLDSSASGMTRKLTTGIAARFATNPIGAIRWKCHAANRPVAIPATMLVNARLETCVTADFTTPIAQPGVSRPRNANRRALRSVTAS